MQSILKKLITGLGKIEMAVCVMLIGLIVLTIIFQIIARYIFNSPVPWMEEAATIGFIFLTLISASVVAREKRHILVDLFPRGPVSKALGVVMLIITVMTLVAILANIAPIVKVELRRETISLPYNFPIAFYNTIPLVYCFCSIILSSLYDLIYERKDEKEAVV